VRNEFFIDTVSESIEDLRSKLSIDAIEFIYPPRRIGGDTGKILTNVLRIREADLVIFDVTPNIISEGEERYNSGVMIEYGIVLALENPISPAWSREQKLTYRVFCNATFQRGRLTPIINQESVTAYTSDRDGKARLLEDLRNILVQGAAEKVKQPKISFKPVGVTFQVQGQEFSIQPQFTS
jgi:hypothetical protein